jgi:hypothetical protein
MAKPKSLILNMEITTAGHKHGCRHNRKGHLLAKGDRRLTILTENHHYCLACAKAFLAKDIERLQKLLAEVDALQQTVN